MYIREFIQEKNPTAVIFVICPSLVRPM